MNWDMANDAEMDSIERACDEGNIEFEENFERYLEEEEEKALFRNSGGDDDGGEEVGDDFGDGGADFDNGFSDWNLDMGLGELGRYNGGGDGPLWMQIALDLYEWFLEDIGLGVNDINDGIYIPTPIITIETELEYDTMAMAFGNDDPYVKALRRAIDDIPEIKAGCFAMYLEELQYELNDWFAGYPEAYIETVYRDRGNDGLIIINGWDPNNFGLLPDVLSNF